VRHRVTTEEKIYDTIEAEKKRCPPPKASLKTKWFFEKPKKADNDKDNGNEKENEKENENESDMEKEKETACEVAHP
jgi:hypothetical protein